MDLHLLRIFETIAEEQSQSKAAKRLSYVPSNLSARLKQLEEELGCTLFSRTRNGMFLTEDGHKLQPLARELLQRERDIFQEMQTPSKLGDLRIGVPDSFARVYLGEPLKGWRAAHPAASIRVRTGFAHEVVRDLEDQVIDIGVVAARSKPAGLKTVKRIPDELCVVTPRDVQELKSRQLSGLQPMILGEACFFGQATLRLYQDAGVLGQRAECIFSIETILQCVALGIGVSVLPRGVVDVHPARTTVNVHPAPRRRAFAYYKVCLPSRAQSALIQEAARYL